MPHGRIAPLFSDQSDRAASDLEVMLINDHYGQNNCIENKSAQWHFRCVVGPLGGAPTTALADAGTLSGSTDAREASAPTGSVASVIAGNTLHATTIGWPDQVKSEASVAGLTVTVGATTVGANFVMARASAVRGLAGAGTASIEGLSINGLPITITGNPNQTITIPGGQVVINERPTSSTSTIVNALHIAVTGVADVIVASATAGIQ